MVASLAAQDQIAEMLADLIPDKILNFKFALPIQERIQDLVQRKKDGTITPPELEELNKYLIYDLLIGLAKARALQSQSLL